MLALGLLLLQPTAQITIAAAARPRIVAVRGVKTAIIAALAAPGKAGCKVGCKVGCKAGDGVGRPIGLDDIAMRFGKWFCWSYLFAALSLAGCWSGGRPGIRQGQGPAKILLISIDTTRADHLSGYGYSRQTTPAIDALAAAGVRFANAYCVMPTTDPSHTSILTGQYPRTHGIMRNAARRADADAPTLASWLQDRGYATAAITARIGLDPPLRRLRGFDHSDAPHSPQRHRSAAEIVERAAAWMGERGEGRWFLWAHLWEPHKPYQPEPGYRNRFAVGGEIAAKLSYEDPARFLAEGRSLSDEVVTAAVALYDAEIARADAAVAEIVKLAREAEPAGEPLVVIVADHGESLAERQRSTRIGFGHGALIYDEVVKVPWILWWPGHLSPAVVDTPVSLVDLAPTLTALIDDRAGSELPGCDGRSLAANVVAGSNPSHAPIVVDRRLFQTSPIPQLGYSETAWIDYPWKLIVNEGRSEPALYRLDSDAAESRDLARDQPQRAAAMAAALAQWKAARPLHADRAPPTRQREQELEALRSLGYID